jgi:hypothetical protein
MRRWWQRCGWLVYALLSFVLWLIAMHLMGGLISAR